MRIALDIDSTLHHYWDQLADVARRRYGISLPYEEQVTWGITALEPDQLAVCIEETHGEELVLAAEPYPGAVETVAGWHAEGHFIHVTSHRSERALEATAQWLARVGLPYDDLHCSLDKVTRCVELGIDLLIDDSPVNLLRARDEGIVAATLRHPWNAELCEREGLLCADDWPALGRTLAPVLDPGRIPPP